MSRTAAILLAAGRGQRMANAVPDKILAPLAGKPVFAHSVSAFYRSGVVDTFIVTYRDQAQLLELSAYAPTPTLFVPGAMNAKTPSAPLWRNYQTMLNMFSFTIVPARSSVRSN